MIPQWISYSNGSSTIPFKKAVLFWGWGSKNMAGLPGMILMWESCIPHLGVSKNGGTPKWMVKIMEKTRLKCMIDWVPLFLETSISGTRSWRDAGCWFNFPPNSFVASYGWLRRMKSMGVMWESQSGCRFEAMNFMWGEFLCWYKFGCVVLCFFPFEVWKFGRCDHCLLGLKKLSGIDLWNHETMSIYLYLIVYNLVYVD